MIEERRRVCFVELVLTSRWDERCDPHRACRYPVAAAQRKRGERVGSERERMPRRELDEARLASAVTAKPLAAQQLAEVAVEHRVRASKQAASRGGSEDRVRRGGRPLLLPGRAGLPALRHEPVKKRYT